MSSDSRTKLRLLVVEDSEDDYAILQRELSRAGLVATLARVESEQQLGAALASAWDLLITDWLMPGFSGMAAIDMVARRGVDLPCIVISGTPNEETAVEALHAGALDFVSKDRPQRFAPAIERALREASERRARVAVERELQISEERYRQAFVVAPEALITYDLARGRIRDANPAAVRLFGYALDELRHMELAALSAPTQPDGRASAELLPDLLARVRATDGQMLEWTFLSKTGQLIPADTHHNRLPTATATLARVTIIDLRERRRIEEIRRHAVELELQNRRIQEANRLKSEFLANMSHELRTPLNAIIGFAELLFDGQVPPESPQHHEFLGDILTSGRHLLQLINDVLDLAKVEAGKLDFRPEAVELERLISEVIAVTRTTAASKRIVVSSEIDPSVTGVVIDPNRFKQIAYNYLSNALKFTPEGGTVIVRVVHDDGEMFRLEVQDTGIGIAPGDVERLFVEFQQLESGSAKRHQGTGLGLALTRRLVEAQGGKIGVRSSPGKGSVFHATLPMVATVLLAPVVMAPARNGGATVLVVEDDARDCELLVESLVAAGYSVEIARTGSEALARCRNGKYDAVTLDLLLPDMTGLELLAALRSEGHAVTTPVVVVTVLPDVRVIAGFTVHDVLRKPLDRTLLLRSLERAGVRPDRPGGILVVDDDDGALRLMDTTLSQIGFSAITRSSGQLGLLAAEQLKPVAVVLDLMMPEMDGVEFLARFRRIPGHGRTPVLIWTAKELSRTEHAHLRETAQAVVSKTGSCSTVVEQLQQLLTQPGAS